MEEEVVALAVVEVDVVLPVVALAVVVEVDVVEPVVALAVVEVVDPVVAFAVVVVAVVVTPGKGEVLEVATLDIGLIFQIESQANIAT